jgi:hypothetical protein
MIMSRLLVGEELVMLSFTETTDTALFAVNFSQERIGLVV